MRFATLCSLCLAFLLAIAAPRAQAQIHSQELTIRQVQEVPADTLAAGYASGDATRKERCQYSPYHYDTVTVTGTVIAAPRISPGGRSLFLLGNANTVYIVDSNGGAWSGLNVRATDSLNSNTLITAVDTGFVVKLTGLVTQYYSSTQFEIGIAASPYTGLWTGAVQVEVLDTKPRRPDPTPIAITDLVLGDPKSSIAMSQQWEGAYVVIRNVTVGTVSRNSSTGRYTWTVTDGAGNAIGVYDQSIYFRGGQDGFDPAWAPPSPGTTISAIRGIITSSGQGIVIAPLYSGDIVLGSFPPVISDVHRSIAIPNSTQAVTVTAHVEDSNPGGAIASVVLRYGPDTATTNTLPMVYNPSAKIASCVIPPQPDGSVIWYALTAKDDNNESVDYPVNAAGPRPFYIVRDGALRIRDVQYTPFRDGNPGCLGDTVTLRGVVSSTADTTSLSLVYMQDASDPWSGIMIRGDATIRALALGSDVSVTGTVAEGYSSSTSGNTALINATVATLHGTAAPYPAVTLPTGTFTTEATPDGTPAAEQWEGMLLRFAPLQVTATNADAYQSKNYGEFLANDGSGDMRVDDWGAWEKAYTTDSTQTALTFLRPGVHIGALTGIMLFNFGNYKLEPRNAQDFEGVTDASSPDAAPAALAIDRLYPSPLRAGSPQLTVSFVLPAAGAVQLTVHDLLGREVARAARRDFAAGTQRATLPVASLTPGCYVVRLADAASTRSASFIVAR
jgi:hypothetical protein